MPEGYEESQRGRPGGFVADPDIMDTWATSSLTPQIAAGWPVREGAADGDRLGSDEALFASIFPYDLRPQGHDIIRTWLFATVTRSYFEHGVAPWKHAAISGWILDPDRKKMSKSKGNAETPEDVVKANGADAVRYWAASGRLGTDAAYDTGQMKVGRRLAIKVLNASKFALGFGDVDGDLRAAVTHPLDLSMLAALADVVDKATQGFEGWDYTRSLEATETFFWTFCDDYLELVKDRAYGGQGDEAAASARAALRLALETLLRLLAPFIPYATEEVWSWFGEGSVHRQSWPTRDELPSGGEPALLASVGAALAGRAQGQVRGQGRHARRGAHDDARRPRRVGRPRAGGRVRPARERPHQRARRMPRARSSRSVTPSSSPSRSRPPRPDPRGVGAVVAVRTSRDGNDRPLPTVRRPRWHRVSRMSRRGLRSPSWVAPSSWPHWSWLRWANRVPLLSRPVDAADVHAAADHDLAAAPSTSTPRPRRRPRAPPFDPSPVLIALVQIVLVLAAARGPRRPRPARPVAAAATPAPRAARGADFAIPLVPTELLEAARDRLRDLETGEPRNAIVAAWLGLETSAAATGLPRLPAETSTEYTERVIGVWPVDSARLGDLAALYREARFSVHDLGESPP